MKRLFALLTAVILTSFFIGCEQKACTAEDASMTVQAKDYHVSFSDHSGKSITLTEKPEKVAVLFSSFADMVLLSGGSVDITVGESIERGFASTDTALVDLGAGKSINTELLLSESPDFIIGSYDIAAHRETSELLENSGIPFALFRVDGFEDYDRVMSILCEIFERPDCYQKNVTEVKNAIAEVKDGIDTSGDKKKILFVRCASSSKATKAKTKDENFVCKMLDELHTTNIADTSSVLSDELSIEYILLEDPDFIFFSPMGDEQAARDYVGSLLETDLWQSLTSIKTGNYAFLPKDMFQYKPNSRWDKAYKYLAELLYGAGTT